MKKFVIFICLITMLLLVNSCAVYSTDDYVYRRNVYYYPYNVHYYRPTPPPYKHKPMYKPPHKHKTPSRQRPTQKPIVNYNKR